MKELSNDNITLEELVNQLTKEFDSVSNKINLLKEVTPDLTNPSNTYSYKWIVDPNQSAVLWQLKQVFYLYRDVCNVVNNTLCSSTSLNGMSVSELEKAVVLLKAVKSTSSNLSHLRERYIDYAFEYILLPLLNSIGLPKQTQQVQRSKIVMKESPWISSIRESIKYTVFQVTTPLIGVRVNIDYILDNLTKTITTRNLQTQTAQELERVSLQRDSIKQATLNFINDYFGSHPISGQLEFFTNSILDGQILTQDEMRVVRRSLEHVLTNAVLRHSSEAIDIKCCNTCNTYVPGEHRCSCGNRRISLYVEISYFVKSNESFVSIQTEAY